MGKFRQKPAQRAPWLRWTIIASSLLLLTVFPGREAIEDQLSLLLQPPSAEAERLAQATTMTPLGQRLFYRQNPTIEPRSAFLNQCKAAADMILLGCYVQEMRGSRQVGGKIIIQDIDDPKFAGITEVTAAHEMLHVAYGRLDDDERKWLVQELLLARKGVTNKRLLKVLDDYAAQDPERYTNELHSHLGTELKDLGNPALEAHYQRYLGDRQTVVALAEQSSQLLTELDQRAEALAAEIEQLESKLKAAKEELEQNDERLSNHSLNLEQRQASLEESQATTEAALRSGDWMAEQLVAQFEQDRDLFNREVETYNAEVNAQSQRIARFNQRVQIYQAKVDAYNEMALVNRKAIEGLTGPVPEPATAVTAP
jgi:hypothetical protein